MFLDVWEGSDMRGCGRESVVVVRGLAKRGTESRAAMEGHMWSLCEGAIRFRWFENGPREDEKS